MSYIVPQKMPLRCFECGHISLSTIYGYGCKITHKSLESDPGINVRRPDWCPLIELPPHGRLADLDEMIEDYWDGNHMEIDEDDLKAISQYKVVIEAEGSETDA